MIHPNRLITVATMIALACNGCATKALIKVAGESHRQSYSGTVRLVSAFSDGDTGYLCFRRSALDIHSETYMARIPIAGNKGLFISYNGDQQSAVKIATDQISLGACEAHGESMPVVDISDQDKLNLGVGQKEAVYVKYAEGGLQALGYVSAKPLYNKSIYGNAIHSYAIDLNESDILSMPGQKRSYLLVLLPVTVAADVVTGVGVGAFAVAYIVLKGCSSTPGGCKGGS